MKMLDPKNVISKSDRMMKVHLEMFSEYLGTYEAFDNNFYFLDTEEEMIKISYEADSKLLTKVFSISLKLGLKDIRMSSSWKVKSSFLGNIKPEGMYFKGCNKYSGDMAAWLNEQTEFVDFLFSETKKVELQNIVIEYNEHSRMLTASVNPYAGAFVWIKMPPVYHDIKLRRDEIEAICIMAELLKKFLKKLPTERETCS